MNGLAGRTRRLIAIFLLVSATIVLFLVSRGKWSDAIIDSGREWIVPDAIARGELLYRDVVYWFGPLTPYLHAAFFEILGSSFRTLAIAGVVGSIGILGALFFGLRAVTGKREAALWTALAIPTLVFMPHAGGSILGMGYRIWHAAAFGLAAICLASRPSGARPALRMIGVGALCGLSGLCRTEWGIVSLLAVWLAAGVRSRDWRRRVREVAVTSAAFLAVFGGTLAAFVLIAGWKTVIADNHLLLTGLPLETRRFLVAYSGIRAWKSGIAEMVYSSAMWLGGFLLVDMAARARSGAFVPRKRIPGLIALLAVLGGAAALGGAGGGVLFSAAPAVSFAGFAAGVFRGHGSRAAALAGTGLAGVVLSYRRPFHITDSAYVGPPLLFAFVCAAGLIRWWVVREKRAPVRSRLRAYSEAAILLLAGLAFAGRAWQYGEDERVPVHGTEGMLSARPGVVKELDAVSRGVRQATRDGEVLVVFPEGEVLNHVSGRPNLLRHKLYIPGYLTEREEPDVILELERWKPRAVVIWNRPTGEYGRGAFGEDYAKRIGQWIRENYVRSRTAARTRSYALYVRHASDR